jgi:hypothetical protein
MSALVGQAEYDAGASRVKAVLAVEAGAAETGDTVVSVTAAQRVVNTAKVVKIPKRRFRWEIIFPP